MPAPTPRYPMPAEYPTTLYLNDVELLTIQTTPQDLQDWVVGFLFAEGLIQRPDQIRRLAIDEDRGLVWVDLPGADGHPGATGHPSKPGGPGATGTNGRRRYLTSGCGNGVTFSSVQDALRLKPVRHGLKVRSSQLLAWMKQMAANSEQYRRSGGMHAAAAVRVASGEMLLREDIGRHNAVDKVVGAMLRAGWRPEETVILTSGRISYEMCSKLARLGVGVGVSRTAATDQAFRLAVKLGIDLVGYVRTARSMRVYTSGERVIDDLTIEPPDSNVDRRDSVWI